MAGERLARERMARYLFRRFLLLLATLAFASMVVFGVLEILPGNAAQVMLGASATPEAVAALAHKLGLDQDIVTRYATWVAGASHGDLGNSYAYSSPIGALIAERLAVSAPLALLAMAIATRRRPGRRRFRRATSRADRRRRRHGGEPDRHSPCPISGSRSCWFCSSRSHWRIAPAGGFPGWGAGVGPALGALILPAIALGLVQAAILTRVTRSALLEVLGEDFIRTARAKGLSARATPVAPRPAQRADADPDHHGPAIRQSDRRRDRRRERVRAARPRSAGVSVDRQSRPAGGRELRDAAGRAS